MSTQQLCEIVSEPVPNFKSDNLTWALRLFQSCEQVIAEYKNEVPEAITYMLQHRQWDKVRYTSWSRKGRGRRMIQWGVQPHGDMPIEFQCLHKVCEKFSTSGLQVFQYMRIEGPPKRRIKGLPHRYRDSRRANLISKNIKTRWILLFMLEKCIVPRPLNVILFVQSF